LPHLASIFRFAAADLRRTRTIVSLTTALLSSPSLLTSTHTTTFVPGRLSSRAGVRSPAREEHIYGIGEIGHTVRLKLDISVFRRDARRSRYSTIVVVVVVIIIIISFTIMRNLSAPEPKAQQYL
jgi:hypothetical protein